MAGGALSGTGTLCWKLVALLCTAMRCLCVVCDSKAAPYRSATPMLMVTTGSESVAEVLLLPQVASEVREGSICLFKDLMDTVESCQKRKMKETVRSALLPLVFRMSDETPSIAKV